MILLKWSKNELLNSFNETVTFDEFITFEPHFISKINHLRELQDVEVNGTLHYDTHSDLATCDFEIHGAMIVPCSITNEDVEHLFSTQSSQVFAFHKVDKDEDIIEVKKDLVELMPVIFQNIILEIPLKVVKENITQYPKGKGWEVVKEETFIKEKEDEIDPRLAKLREFKIEEDS